MASTAFKPVSLLFIKPNLDDLTVALLPVNEFIDDDADDCIREEFRISFDTSVCLFRLVLSLRLFWFDGNLFLLNVYIN